jgi:transcriptional regulator with PAS, ATPase and Fis domain
VSDPTAIDGRTAAAPTGPQASVPIVAATIDVLRGPDAGATARVESPSFVIGTSQSADLRLTDATVSREHLRLTLDAAGLRLRDDASRNGTWIGGARIQSAVITADTTLRLGNTTIALRLDPGPLQLAVSPSTEFGGAIGASPAMRHVFALLERAAQTDVTVLLEGESGVGKDVLSNALHAKSPRAEGELVAVDCGAIPPNLIESELFGHVKGAFTGATAARVGLLARAHRGTLFLDEIGELPLDLQPKLLRFLETREVRPVGGASSETVDVRVIAATNRRLLEAVESGAFRKDLFYRLAVVRIVVPPLRDRAEDIAPLATAFLRAATGDPGAELPADLAALLATYAWPGNVRELRNAIDRYAHLGVRDARGLFDEAVRMGVDPAADLSLLPLHEARRRALDQFEKAYVPRVLARAGGVVARAAELAGVARPSFYRMLDRLALRGESDE